MLSNDACDTMGVGQANADISVGSSPRCDGSHHLRLKAAVLSHVDTEESDDEREQSNAKRARTVGTERPVREGGGRRGKWTNEEQAYADRLIRDFEAGLLPLENGATLRAYLSKKLNCDPMRISKKFAGQKCLGKQIFQRRSGDESNGAPSSSSMYTSTMAPLTIPAGVRDDAAIKALEEAFQRSIASAAANKGRNRTRVIVSSHPVKTATFATISSSATLANTESVQGVLSTPSANVTPDGSTESALALGLHGGGAYSAIDFGKRDDEKGAADKSCLSLFGNSLDGRSAEKSFKPPSPAADEGGTSESSCSDSDNSNLDFPDQLSSPFRAPQSAPDFFESGNAFGKAFDGQTDDQDSWGDEYFEAGRLGSSSSSIQAQRGAGVELTDMRDSAMNLSHVDFGGVGMDSWWTGSSFDDDGGMGPTSTGTALQQPPTTSSAPESLLLLDGSDLLDYLAPRNPLPVARLEAAAQQQSSKTSVRKVDGSGVCGSSGRQPSTAGIMQQVLLCATVEPMGDFLPDECFTF